jgi:hypothetical protein
MRRDEISALSSGDMLTSWAWGRDIGRLLRGVRSVNGMDIHASMDNFDIYLMVYRYRS